MWLRVELVPNEGCTFFRCLRGKWRWALRWDLWSPFVVLHWVWLSLANEAYSVRCGCHCSRAKRRQRSLVLEFNGHVGVTTHLDWLIQGYSILETVYKFRSLAWSLACGAGDTLKLYNHFVFNGILSLDVDRLSDWCFTDSSCPIALWWNLLLSRLRGREMLLMIDVREQQLRFVFLIIRPFRIKKRCHLRTWNAWVPFKLVLKCGLATAILSYTQFLL